MRMDYVGTRICMNNGKIKTLQKRKAHTTFGTSAATKVPLGLFLLVALATDIKIPEHQTHTNSTFTEKVTNRFHEVN